MGSPSGTSALLAVVSVLLVTAGCDSGSEPDLHPFLEVRQGQIVDFGRPVRVVINGIVVSSLHGGASTDPVAVQAGVPFEVTTSPLGAPCIRPAPSEVETTSRTATVAVRDSAFGGPCVFILIEQPRTDRIGFEEPGDAEVVVRGSAYNEQGIEGPLPQVELRFPVIVE